MSEKCLVLCEKPLPTLVSRIGTRILSALIFFMQIMSCLFLGLPLCRASLVAQLIKNPSAMRETWVQSLSWEDSLEERKATYSSILAWRIPWIYRVHGVTKSRTQLSDSHFPLQGRYGSILRPSIQSLDLGSEDLGPTLHRTCIVWVSHITSLDLRFFICKMSITLASSQSSYEQ